MTDNNAISEMQKIARFLLKYQKTKEDISTLSILKTRELNVFGYDITFNYSIDRVVNTVEQQDYELHTLHLYSKYFPFLPFNIVSESAIKFLGDKELGLLEFIVSGRKMYCWSCLFNAFGVACPLPEATNGDVERRKYGDLEYFYCLKPKLINLSSF
jgi:hypothetical protein